MIKIELVRFEAQDIITASVDSNCICIADTHWIHPDGTHYIDAATKCPANNHAQ